ncbi:TonB-dependent receptor [Ponticaulis sp.]|uniref:TonB-dependent receptor domain-containing protein n=1 Tax=Ponticaulis sp. TaxID=2020902 RepID=UPI0025E74C46|nr:TonB-dependent receptor [Ponticaulis sp.]
MNGKLLKSRLLTTSVFAGFLGAMTIAPAIAQEAEPEDDLIIITEEESGDEARQERVVVTGSRLVRDEFSSASPLKVLDVEESVAAGLVDTATIVQRTSVSGGVQTDNTFTGFSTDGGQGASNVSLRGLDPERTLIMANGRRLAPSGVAGAPTRPDLNLIPLGMIERVDVLTDGASSVYGADAVAGVINFITRREFEGIEFDLFTSTPEAGGGEERRLSVSTGISADNGYAAFGFEYYTRDEVRRGERDFTPCIRDYEVNPSTGDIRSPCYNGTFGNMFLDPTNLVLGDVTNDGLGIDFGVYGFDFDNGSGFNLIPSNEQAGAPGSDLGSDWLMDPRYNANAVSDDFALAQGIDRYSFFTNGEYQTDVLGNATFYYEGLYANRSQSIFIGGAQAFPSIPCTNPYIQADPVLSQTPACDTTSTYQPILAAYGYDQLLWLPYLIDQIGPYEVDVSTARGVFGMAGDLEGVVPTGSVQFGSENFGINVGNLTYDLWGSFDHNTGINRQRTFNEERLYASIATARDDGTGNIICGYSESGGDLFGYITTEDCVPIDPTDPDVFLYGTLPQEALDYLSGYSTTTTTIEQTMLQGSITGDVAYLPAGTVPFAIGFEYRKDSIETLNSYLTTSASGTDGNSEGNTIGDTSLLEMFFETEIPVLRGQPLAEELTFNVSGRWTEEENFGALWTYRVQGIYRPTDWLTGRASFGTTYRAPNLREQFLASQTSFASAFIDPCVNSVYSNYDAETQAIVLANCQAQGADPNTLGVGGATTPQVVTGGTTALSAETSEGLTAGFVFEQPWVDDFDLSLAVSYYNIEIENSVEEPSVGYILNQCLVQSTNLNSPFCQLIDRSSSADPSRNFISTIDSSFVNVGLIETDGVDFDVRYLQDFVVGGNELNLSVNLSATYVMMYREDLFDVTESYDGRPYLPKWRGDLQTQLGYRDFTLNWNTYYVGKTADDDIDALRADDIVDVRTGEAVFLAGYRDVEETDEYVLHDLSVAYEQDTWSVLVGVRNIFDETPPLVDEGEGYFTSANVVLGGGYDVYGRTLFARLTKSF